MSKKPNPEAIKEQMLAHLEEKYGEEFVPISLSLSDWAYSYDRLQAYPKQGSEQDHFEVWGTKMEDGSYHISDGYFGIFIRPQYEAALSEVVSGTYDDFKLYVEFGEGVLPDRLTKDTTIAEIYRPDENFSSETVIFVKQSSVEGKDVEASLRQIAGKMREQKMVGFVRLYTVVDEKYDSIGSGPQNLSALQDEGYFVGDYTSVMVTPDMRIRQNGEEVQADG
ncbi:hypothetical protein [Paenibacillus ihumii]|uniref:hypothetical protein n=1 Tax=Paenibacillus ihumii TaxID=687436 RepID=UPI0011DDFAC8|nr:hypothetical protein [Paenibacillus ihumii]